MTKLERQTKHRRDIGPKKNTEVPLLYESRVEYYEEVDDVNLPNPTRQVPIISTQDETQGGIQEQE